MTNILGGTLEGGTQRIGAFTRLPALIRQLGADPDALLAEAGLAANALDQPEDKVPYAALTALVARMSARTACPHLGLLVGRMWQLSELGVLGEAVRNSRTVGDALRTLAVHQHLNSGGGLVFTTEDAGVAELGYAIYHPRIEGASLYLDAVLTAGSNYLRDLVGPSATPTEVLFAHPKPPDLAPYRAVFRVTPRFESERTVLRFPAAWLARPVIGADPAKFADAMSRIERAGRGALLQQVTRAVRILMLSDEISGEAAAQALAMHRRTLNRRLKAQGTTFQEVLDRVRAEAACQLLEGTRTSLDDIAATLGYASVSAFMRAFRRWTGVAPGQWRRGVRRDSIRP